MNHPATFGTFAPRNGSPFANPARSTGRNLHWVVTAILFLEQHYIDRLGGVLVAVLAIYLVDASSRTPSLE